MPDANREENGAQVCDECGYGGKAGHSSSCSHWNDKYGPSAAQSYPLPVSAEQTAVNVIRRWKADREQWASAGPRNGFPPSWPMSFADTARLVLSLADRLESS